MELKTPLYDEHVLLKGKIVPFAGYLLPVQYEGVIKEHLAVRKECGMFDVSHMGEIVFRGETALASLNHILTNDFTNMPLGKVRYSLMCNSNGGVIDDLLVYKFADDYYYVVVNASNRHKDFEHMKNNILEGTTIEDISDSIGQIALQGPNAEAVMKTLLPEESIPQKYYTAIEHVDIDGTDCMISYTGYTGEKGYEIYTDNEGIVKVWRLLLEKGKDFGLIPCGLGARDTLRLEAGMPLYGHEMNDEVTPFEADLGFGVKMAKEEFIGKKALEEKGEPKIVRAGLQIIDKGVMREHQDIYVGDRLVGHTSSGTYSPLLETSIAQALIEKEYSGLDTVVEVDIRGRRVKAKVVKMPFYDR
ncbi:MAG: glycine cleavage system aminomethyltransferase GcvT [Erysipelotrichaceae bacterium]|nr:glycine cleavage system aminomethyltransferase GcvT [Erysipelotrichaceae bacterium]